MDSQQSTQIEKGLSRSEGSGGHLWIQGFRYGRGPTANGSEAGGASHMNLVAGNTAGAQG